MLGWLARFRRKREFQPIAPGEWQSATADYLFMRGLPPAQSEHLRLLASDFLRGKRIEGAAGLEITDLMRTQIAAQACILILELGLDYYAGWSDIIVYPGQFVPEREVMDEDGVVHVTNDPLAGEAWLGGPVILSYDDVALTSDAELRVAGYNVVIHEFAHKLDMLNGEPNGYPPLHKGMSTLAWQRDFKAAYEDFCARVGRADARAERGDLRALDALPVDAYASENPAEFFAVISEAFFETPEAVHDAFPRVYAQLKAFYRQDPGARSAAGG